MARETRTRARLRKKSRPTISVVEVGVVVPSDIDRCPEMQDSSLEPRRGPPEVPPHPKAKISLPKLRQQ